MDDRRGPDVPHRRAYGVRARDVELGAPRRDHLGPARGEGPDHVTTHEPAAAGHQDRPAHEVMRLIAAILASTAGRKA